MLVAAPSASTEQMRLNGIAMTMPKPSGTRGRRAELGLGSREAILDGQMNHDPVEVVLGADNFESFSNFIAQLGAAPAQAGSAGRGWRRPVLGVG
jgi:hypothetical protein